MFIENKITWKLIDFGLATHMPFGRSIVDASIVGGTPVYMSPKALNGKKSPANDIYSLGVTFFQVLNGWEHPSRDKTGGRSVERWEIPVEVQTYCEYLKRDEPRGAEPPGYQKERWSLGSSFNEEKLEDGAIEQLRDIIYKMMEMSRERRFKTAEQTEDRFINWRDAFLGSERSD